MFVILHLKAYSMPVSYTLRIVIYNFLDLEKYSLKQSFNNFKKRVGDSHVLLHNMLVELFKANIKRHFEWSSGHHFSLKLCRSVLLFLGMLRKNLQVNLKILATPNVHVCCVKHIIYLCLEYYEDIDICL